MALGRILYQAIAIDFQGDTCGRVTIARCYFSHFYTAQVCRLMSAMDRGLFAGLLGRGRLDFTARMTEGHDCCRALFAAQEEAL